MTTTTTHTTTAVGPAPGPIAYVDTETDGTHHGRLVWEIAIIRPDLDHALAIDDGVFHAFVEFWPRPNSNQFALQLGKFWDRHPAGRKLAGKPPLPIERPGAVPLLNRADVALRVHQLLAGATVVGVNPGFDTETLGTLLRSADLPDEPWDYYHLEDLVAETVGYLRARVALHHYLDVDHLDDPYADLPTLTTARSAIARPWKSTDLAAALGVEPTPEDQRHTALADARWAQRWHQRLTALTHVPA